MCPTHLRSQTSRFHPITPRWWCGRKAKRSRRFLARSRSQSRENIFTLQAQRRLLQAENDGRALRSSARRREGLSPKPPILRWHNRRPSLSTCREGPNPSTQRSCLCRRVICVRVALLDAPMHEVRCDLLLPCPSLRSLLPRRNESADPCHALRSGAVAQKLANGAFGRKASKSKVRGL